MMWNHNFTMMNGDEETADPVGTASKRMMRTTGPRSFGRRMVRVGMGLLLLLHVAEGAVIVPEEAAMEGTGWSDPASSSPGRQGRVVGAGRASKAAAADEGVVMMKDGHDTTTSRRYNFAAAGTKDGSRLHEFSLRPETVAATAEEDGIEMMEDGSRTHEFSTPRRVNIKNSKKTSQSLAESEQSGKPYVPKYKTIYVIRHANKREGDDHTKASLCKAGRSRRDQLPSLFSGYPYPKKTSPLFAKPNHLFAYIYRTTGKKPVYKVQRCLETLTALEKVTGLPANRVEYHHDYQNSDGAKAMFGKHGLGDPKHMVVLAAWEHTNIHALAKDLGMTDSQEKKLTCDPKFPKDWMFDYVYTFRYDNWPSQKPTHVSCHYENIYIKKEDYKYCHSPPYKTGM